MIPGVRPCRPSLRMRLWLGAGVLAGLAIAAALIAVTALSRTQVHAHEAMAAQTRIEAYGTFSIRVNEWMLGWLSAGRDPGAAPVLAALDRLDQLLAEDVAAAGSQGEADRRARQAIGPARLRGFFLQLDRALKADPPGTPGGDAAIAFHASQAPAAAAMQVEQETLRRDRALQSMQALRRPLLGTALAIALAAPLVLATLYFLTLRPLFSRLRHATRAAEAMAGGLPLPPGAGGHDELGLMFARLRQMAARVERRRARLESIVAERTSELSQANRRLERIDSSRRRFFADVGHELRTPLTVILGEAELGAASRDAATRASFETIRNRALRLFRRIEDLLRIARSESGQLELARRPVALGEAIAAAQADLAPLLRRAGIRVETSLPDGLTGAGDPEWLRQVFAGLFENAAKYAGEGAHVAITGGTRDGRLWVEFADDGPGLPAGADQRVFDRFGQGQPQAAPGFGVGLALARWVMEASGGSLAALPSERGLRLGLELPLWEGREWHAS